MDVGLLALVPKSNKCTTVQNPTLVLLLSGVLIPPYTWFGGWGVGMLRWHSNFCKIFHRFSSSFANPSFQDPNGSHIMYWNMMILNPSRFKVEPYSKYWYFALNIETYFHYASRKTPCYFSLNGCAIKLWEM